MASSFGKKESVFTKGKRMLRNAFLLAAGAVAPGYYFYGTVEEKVVTVRGIEYVSTEEGKYQTIIRTNKGSFTNDAGFFHAKDEDDAKDITAMIDNNKTYKIKSYGAIGDFTPFGKPNIIKVEEAVPPVILSGKETKIQLTVDSMKVQLVIPAETKGLIKIESITPVKKVLAPADSL